MCNYSKLSVIITPLLKILSFKKAYNKRKTINKIKQTRMSLFYRTVHIKEIVTVMEKEATELSASVTNKTAIFKKRPIYFINIIYI